MEKEEIDVEDSRRPAWIAQADWHGADAVTGEPVARRHQHDCQVDWQPHTALRFLVSAPAAGRKGGKRTKEW